MNLLQPWRFYPLGSPCANAIDARSRQSMAARQPHCVISTCDFHPNGGFLVMSRLLTVIGAFVALLAVSPALAEKSIVVSSTTSTQDSGLFGRILPLFKAKTGIDVKVVALGTGQALDAARRGDADVVFAHAKAAEEKFLAEGFGVKRYPVMYNDFILIGPKSDPAHIAGSKDIVEALKTIKAKNAPFISRGDKSGTHIAEIN